MLIVWPRGFDDHFGIWNGSYGRHLLFFWMRFFLCSTLVLGALPHLQKVMNLRHSLQLSRLSLIVQFQVIFSFRGIRFCAITCQYSNLGLSKVPNYDIFLKHLASSFKLFPANIISPKGETGLHSNTMWHNRESITSNIVVIATVSLRFLLLAPLVSNIQLPKCPANHHGIRLVISNIPINLSPVGWQFSQNIEISPCSCQLVYCMIDLSWCHFSDTFRC